MVTLDDRIHFPFQLVFIPFLNSSHVILLTAELSVDQPGNTVVSSLVLLFFCLFKCYTHCGHTTCKIKICWLVNSWSLSLPVLGLQKELLTFRLSSHFYQSNQRSTLCQLPLAFFSWKIEVNFPPSIYSRQRSVYPVQIHCFFIFRNFLLSTSHNFEFLTYHVIVASYLSMLLPDSRFYFFYTFWLFNF